MRKSVLLLAAVLAGCAAAPVKTKWAPGGGPYGGPARNFTLDIPQGWQLIDEGGVLLLSKEGPLLQSIFVKKVAVSASMEHTKKTMRAGMLPQEAAEIWIDDYRADTDLLNLKVEENSPATVAGRPAFRIAGEFRVTGGMRRKFVACGLMDGDDFYLLRFSAPARYYFSRDLPAFEEVVRSFRLAKGS